MEPLGHSAHRAVDAYEYIANHHSYKRDEHPTVKISYNLSPLQVGRLQPGVSAVCQTAAVCQKQILGTAAGATLASTAAKRLPAGSGDGGQRSIHAVNSHVLSMAK